MADGAADLAYTSTLALNNGGAMPVFGLGVYQSGSKTKQACLWALEDGYRHIDTAALYDNEVAVGEAVRASGIPREDIFITTKLWNSDHGDALGAFEESLDNLGLDYVDLYLMHSPLPKKRLEAWRAMIEIQESGRAKAIGVSNFGIHHLEEFIEETGVVPAVNQLEIHPFLTRSDLVAFCKEKGIVVTAYSPLTKGEKLDDATLVAIADAVGKTPAQVMIRWSLQHGYVCIPKSTNKKRIKENGDVWDFELSADQMAALDGLDEYYTTGWDPTTSK